MDERTWWRVTFLETEFDEDDAPAVEIGDVAGTVESIDVVGSRVDVAIESPLGLVDVGEDGTLPYDPCAGSDRAPDPWMRTRLVDGRAVIEVAADKVACDHDRVRVERLAEPVEVDPARVAAFDAQMAEVTGRLSDMLNGLKRLDALLKGVREGTIDLDAHLPDGASVDDLTVGDLMDLAAELEVEA